jgi:hypothetical protein
MESQWKSKAKRTTVARFGMANFLPSQANEFGYTNEVKFVVHAEQKIAFQH